MAPMDAICLFSEIIDFAHNFMANHLPFTLPPYRSASGIGYASNKLSKMAGSSAAYQVNTW